MAQRGDGRRCGGNYIVTAYASPMPAGKENLGGDALAGDVARKTVAVDSSYMRTNGAT